MKDKNVEAIAYLHDQDRKNLQHFIGSAYSVRMTYTGAQTVTVGEKKPEVTDHVTVVVNGPKSDFTVEINYARDAARTPLLIRIPQAVGTLSMELVR